MTFRLLPYAENSACFNMAVDEAILEAHLAGLAPATLRFYGWAPSAVSLGYAQKIDNALLERMHSSGFDVVRRPTGGRAVLHQGDLTYSFVGSSLRAFPLDGPSVAQSGLTAPEALSASVSASYLQICQGLLSGLKKLGVEAEIGRGRRPYNRYHDCFQTTTTADLQVKGLKIIGSAQLRRKHAVLQHGSILLQQEQNALPQLLGESDPQSGRRQARHCNLFELIEARAISEIEAAFVEGFAASAGEVLLPGKLTDWEFELAQKNAASYAVSVSCPDSVKRGV